MKSQDKDLIENLVIDWKRERPELDASAMLIVGRILNLGKTLEKRMDKVLKDTEICYSDLDVLATLRRSGKPYELTPKELMQSVLITSGAMTALLDRLTKRDLIYRSVDEKDSRVKRAGLTKKGIKTIGVAIENRFKDASETISELNEREKEILSKLLKKMMLHFESE